MIHMATIQYTNRIVINCLQVAASQNRDHIPDDIIKNVIEPTACILGRGNEKGRVKRQVNIDHDQFLRPCRKYPSCRGQAC